MTTSRNYLLLLLLVIPCYTFKKNIKSIRGPLYDGQCLHDTIRQNLPDNIKLGDTLTNVVIPTFDINRLQPVIFSSYEIKEKPYMNVKLSDICIATSAAPTYLPPHYFETIREKKKIESDVSIINLICYVYVLCSNSMFYVYLIYVTICNM
ncbi:putative galactolipase [Helianthus anomalus]